MSAEVSGTRPPVITEQTRTALDEYCAFRHVVRNVYTFDLRAERIQALAEALPSCFQRLAQDVQAFCDVLQALA